MMGKVKNVKTEHYIAEIPEDGLEADYLRLAVGILDVDTDSDEETDEFAYYDGDGTAETEVLSVKQTHPFNGHYVHSDPAQELVASKEFASGDDRKVLYKQVRPEGKTLIGEATLTGIEITGGPAEEYRPIVGNITWNRIPEITDTP